MAVVNTAHELDVLIMFLELNATINNTADGAGIYIDVDDVTLTVESVTHDVTSPVKSATDDVTSPVESVTDDVTTPMERVTDVGKLIFKYPCMYIN